MSDLDVETRDWRLSVQDMIEFAEQAVAYAEGLDQRAFTADRRTYDATLRNIELLGEAATHVPGVGARGTPSDRVAADHGDQESRGARVHGHRRRCHLGHHPDGDPEPAG